MADMSLKAEVLLRLEGSEELHNVGTIDVPINLTLGDKPSHKPGYRAVAVNIDEAELTKNVDQVAAHLRPRDTLNAMR